MAYQNVLQGIGIAFVLFVGKAVASDKSISDINKREEISRPNISFASSSGETLCDIFSEKGGINGSVCAQSNEMPDDFSLEKGDSSGHGYPQNSFDFGCIQEDFVKTKVNAAWLDVLNESFILTPQFNHFMQDKGFLLVRNELSFVNLFSPCLAADKMNFVSFFSLFDKNSSSYKELFKCIFDTIENLPQVPGLYAYLQMILDHQLSQFMVLCDSSYSIEFFQSSDVIKKISTYLSDAIDQTDYCFLSNITGWSHSVGDQACVVWNFDKENESLDLDALRSLMSKNPALKILVDINQGDVGARGILGLPADLGPLKLILTNVSGDIQSLDKDFLLQYHDLKSLTLCGFSGLKSIQNNVLYQSNLDVFCALGLISLQSIGDNFLYGAECLHSFYCAYAPSLISVSDNFLYGAEYLQEFSTDFMMNVRHISHNFMRLCSNVKVFNASNLISLESIGNNFLCESSLIQFLDASKWNNLTSIGDNFMRLASNLIDFKASGLINLRSVGDDCLLAALKLETFDASSLRKLESVGSGWLRYAIALMDFDASGLISLQTLGYGCLGANHGLYYINIDGLNKDNPIVPLLLRKKIAL